MQLGKKAQPDLRVFSPVHATWLWPSTAPGGINRGPYLCVSFSRRLCFLTKDRYFSTEMEDKQGGAKDFYFLVVWNHGCMLESPAQI